MNKTFVITELGIVVSANTNNPSVLNPDFLKYNDIVPRDWTVAVPPICVGPVAQVQYSSGITVLAQPEKLIFSETLGAEGSPRVPDIAAKYIRTLPHVGYTALGVNPRGHVLAGSEDVASAFVLKNIVASGPWTELQGRSPKVAIRFSYPLHTGGVLNLSVEDGKYAKAEAPSQSVILFAANFHRTLATDGSVQERVDEICTYLSEWRRDLEMFRAVVDEQFMRATVSYDSAN